MINFIDDNVFIVPYVSYANLLCKKKKKYTGNIYSDEFHFSKWDKK
jgi:hypothetical protein